MSKNEIINILLVEDDMQDCKIIKDYVDARDDVKLVKIANSSKEAIKDIKVYVPEAIILDIELNNGEGSGLQVLEQIKELDMQISKEKSKLREFQRIDNGELGNENNSSQENNDE